MAESSTSPGHATRTVATTRGVLTAVIARSEQAERVPNAPWRVVRLGDVAKTSSGGTPKRTSSAYYGGGIPWVKSGELGDSTVYETSETISKAGLEGSSAKIFPKGTLCVALYGATVGKLGILGVDAATNQAVCGIFLPPEIDTRFAYRFLESKRRQLVESAKGGAQPNISQEIIRDLQFPLPPLPEQRRIVAEIETQFTRLDAGIAALRRVQANLKRYRAAVLKAACEGRLVPTEAELARQQAGKRASIPRKNATPDFESGAKLLERILADRRRLWAGRGSYKDPVTPKTSNLLAPPEGWTWASIEQLTADSMIGLDRGRAQQSENAEVGVPYIKMNNVTMDGRVLFDDMMFVPASKEEAASFAVREGDILFNTRNSKELVGKVGLVRSPPVGAIYNNNLMRIRVLSCVSPAFLSLQMCSHGFRQRMELVKKATTNIAAVYGKDLWPLPIALPPLAEQTRIVAEVERRLSVVEELETVVNANLQRATRLRQSVLQQAFRGHIAAQ